MGLFSNFILRKQEIIIYNWSKLTDFLYLNPAFRITWENELDFSINSVPPFYLNMKIYQSLKGILPAYRAWSKYQFIESLVIINTDCNLQTDNIKNINSMAWNDENRYF